MSAAVFQPRRAGPRGAPFGHRACAGVRPRGMWPRPRVPPRCMYVSVEVRPRPRTRKPGRDCRLPPQVPAPRCRRARDDHARPRADACRPDGADWNIAAGHASPPTHRKQAAAYRKLGGVRCSPACTRRAARSGTRCLDESRHARFARRQNSAGVESAAGQGRHAPPRSSTRMRTHAHRTALTAPRVPAPARQSACAAAPLPRSMQSIRSERRPGARDARTRRSPRPRHRTAGRSVSRQIARHLRAARAVPHAPHTKNPARRPGSVLRPLDPA